MKAPVILYILLAFLDQGSSLQCEVCDAIGDSCSGSMQTCDPGEDTCGIMKDETILGGEKVVTYAKECLSSDACRDPFLSMDFGKGIRQRTSIACCTGEACRTTSVQLPPVNTTLNGLQCPACFSIGSSDCDTEIAYCTGSETYCIDFAGSFSSGEGTLNTGVKGCISVSECTRPEVLMKAGQDFSMDFTQFECKPASPAASKSSGWTLLTMPCFPIMVGFILIKTMP
ncbi:phospholipase A2 inhibitor and Ly6/PLAUR domain-containing protein [Alligator mississippiensis]|uniref:phospholipase A2 inhibitor and Ly6/PLAUR domain-containing protein n=1 Tax=Alligator mississippiensis TaxID=8496 RepID=UPI00090750FE|nr:phospholipase A2 inhibitor and Ly6/PLAUR domain-containing protein [Alligator mississippiensis]